MRTRRGPGAPLLARPFQCNGLLRSCSTPCPFMWFEWPVCKEVVGSCTGELDTNGASDRSSATEFRLPSAPAIGVALFGQFLQVPCSVSIENAVSSGVPSRLRTGVSIGCMQSRRFRMNHLTHVHQWRLVGLWVWLWEFHASLIVQIRVPTFVSVGSHQKKRRTSPSLCTGFNACLGSTSFLKSNLHLDALDVNQP